MSPYLLAGLGAGVLGIAIGAGAMHATVDATQLARVNAALSTEKAAHARDNEQAALNLKTVSDTAARAARDALAKQTAMQQTNDAAQAALSTLQGEKNAVDEKYRAAVAAGTQRVRVAVRNCRADDPAGSGAVRSDPQSASGNVDAPASADLDPAVTGRVFGVAADDQLEIDKLTRLQAWACTVKPDAPGCAANQKGDVDDH